MNRRMLRRLDVTLSGQRVGCLEMDRGGLVTWAPEAEWEARGQHPRLGVAFLRTLGPRHAGTGLPAWFENLLPEEGSALRQRLCIAHGIREGNRFRLLEAIGTDLCGAVEITPTTTTRT
jgi:HipA-like protein